MPEYTLKELKIELTYKCPLSCVHCSSDANEDNHLEMSKDNCFDIITQASEMGTENIAFSGGEPLLWDGLEEVISLSNHFRMNTSIYSSGNCDNIEAKFEQLACSGLKKSIFSIYSPNEKEHIRITRKRNSFQNTLKAIEVCRKNNIVPEIHFVALASNYKCLYDIVELAKNIGVEKVSVLRFVPQGRGVLIENKDTLSKVQNLELKRIIENIRKDGYNIRTGSPFNFLLLNDRPNCFAAKDRMIIAPDLTVYPCDAFKQISAKQITSDTYGCSLKDCSLKECWDNSTYLNQIRRITTDIFNTECCSCGLYDKCGSGCLAQKFLYYNSLEPNKDPACIK